jgi:fructose-1,6-bisphosphatase II
MGSGADAPSPPTGSGEIAVRALEPIAHAATRSAALACQPWFGRGDDKAADGAATEAMRESLSFAPGCGTVVIGEGEKDEAPMLHNGEQVGTGEGPDFDIAVDPLECTKFCAAGLPGALATIAMAEGGSLWSPGTAHYMDKLVVGREARDAIDITKSPEDNIRSVAEALDKPVGDMRVVVLDKPRHEELIDRLRAAGAAVSAPADGDVAGALAALLPDGPADMLVGVGGTPEGVMTACAVASLGGGMQGRLAPQSDEEAKKLADADVDVDRALTLDELVQGASIFVATGVSGGDLLRRPWEEGDTMLTESIVITSGGVRRIVEQAAVGAAELGASTPETG